MKEIRSYTSAQTAGIRLNANENNFTMQQKIRDEIISAISEIDFNRYPDSDETELLEAYSAVTGIPSSLLLAGNGSDQMLGYMIGTFLGKGKKLITLDPDFSMYDYYASSYEAGVEKFRISEDGTFDPDDFIRAGRQCSADMVLFSNPNNPTGNCLCIQTIEKITAAFADIPVVIDEAYMDFSDEQSAITLIDRYPNLYVTRTLSKAFGMAGIRIGFLISNMDNMSRLKKGFVPYALNSMSMKAACVILKYADEYKMETELIKRERERVYKALSKNSAVIVHDSSANFIYGKTGRKDELLALLKENNIVIRDYAGSPYFRITIGTPQENDIILSIFEQFEEDAK